MSKRYNLVDFLQRRYMEKIGEDPDQIRWITLDPVYYEEDNFKHLTRNDINIGYDGYAIPCECKSSKKKEKKALKQMLAGYRHITEDLHLDVPYMKFIVPKRNGKIFYCNYLMCEPQHLELMFGSDVTRRVLENEHWKIYEGGYYD